MSATPRSPATHDLGIGRLEVHSRLTIAFGMIGALIIAVLLAFAVREVLTRSMVGSDPLPPDIAAHGLEATPISPEGKISREQALEVVRQEFGDMFAGGRLETYLVELTDPSTLRGSNPIDHRAVWLIRASGVSIPGSRPLRGDGTPADAPDYTVAYVYVDAGTGEWLLTWMQGQGP